MRRWVLGQGGGSGERNTPHPHPLASGRDGRDGERRAQGGIDTCFLGRLGFLMFVDVREKVESHTLKRSYLLVWQCAAICVTLKT
jgi:hypothetical protein